MEVLTSIDSERITKLLADDAYFWLDLRDPSPADLEQMSTLLDLHPAAVEDTREWDQLPKVDDYGEHVLIVFFTAAMAADSDSGRAVPLEVHVYASGGWIVTARRCPCRLDRLHDRLAETTVADEDEIVYHVLDALADGWDPVIGETDIRVDRVEGEVLERPRQGQLTVIYRLKQEIGDLLRHSVPQAEMFPGAIEVIHNLPGLDRGSREWLRDVEAHLDSTASNLRRLVADLHALTETYFNANANRLNRLATVIAVGSVFFLVWTLVTGFFGQNFGWLVDHVKTRSDFFVFGIGGMLLPTIILGAIAYWRRRDWW